MVCNHLEERLEAIRNQKKLTLKRIEIATTEREVVKLNREYEILNKEEQDCLKNLGVI